MWKSTTSLDRGTHVVLVKDMGIRRQSEGSNRISKITQKTLLKGHSGVVQSVTWATGWNIVLTVDFEGLDEPVKGIPDFYLIQEGR